MTFHDLHHEELPLLLPNAWDVASALAFLDAGFRAVGTTSFGVAASAGHADGARSTKEANRELARLLRALPCHVSMDIEDGYDDDPERVADYAAGLGVAGINIEDSSAERLIAPATRTRRRSRRSSAAAPGCSSTPASTPTGSARTPPCAATLERAAAYVEAGADGIFVPGATDPAQLRELTAAIPVPVNVLAHPTLSLAELGALGVRRVSTGSLPYRAAIDAAVAVAAVRPRRAPGATGDAVPGDAGTPAPIRGPAALRPRRR